MLRILRWCVSSFRSGRGDYVVALSRMQGLHLLPCVPCERHCIQRRGQVLNELAPLICPVYFNDRACWNAELLDGPRSKELVSHLASPSSNDPIQSRNRYYPTCHLKRIVNVFHCIVGRLIKRLSVQRRIVS